MSVVELDSAYVSWLHYTPLSVWWWCLSLLWTSIVLFLYIVEEGIGRLDWRANNECNAFFQEVLFAKSSWIKWLFSIEQHMFLLAGEKKAEARLGELLWFRQQDLNYSCPVCIIVACRFPVLLKQIFAHWLRVSLGLKGGRMQQCFSA